MLNITLQGGEKLIAALRSKPAEVLAVLTTRVNVLMVQLQSKIVGEKLSGQVLQHRTGKLAASIRAEAAHLEGTKIVGAVYGAGGPAFYGAIHEYGAPDPWAIMAVNARALHFLSEGREVFAKSVTHPPLPIRGFMSPSLDEMAPTIQTELQSAIDAELEK